jgi:2-hydroxy-3-keto-5-methylthiopentenyl-1-phosphate phosphatase
VSSGRPVPVRSIVIDFDGTISIGDVSEGLLEVFADPGWTRFNAEFERGEIGSRECIEGQAALLRATADELVGYAVKHFPIDPTFAPFVEWSRGAGIEVSIASDGLGLHLTPMLAAAGIDGLPIVTNVAIPGGVWRMEFPGAHPECVYCGACKMNATLAARARAGPTAFIGDGHSDTFGALFADVVFAKRILAEHCRAEGVPFVEWETFDDVRAALEGDVGVPGPVNPPVCPGWTVP